MTLFAPSTQKMRLRPQRKLAGNDFAVLVAKPGGPSTGVGRYVHMLQAGLEELGLGATRVAPAVPPLPEAVYGALRRAGVDLRAFLSNYPVWARFPPAQVYHLTSQNLASLLLFRRPPGRVVVTVHDIIPYMLRNNRALSSYRTVADRVFDWMAMLGLRRADHLLADSHYTRRCVIEQLGIAAQKISVVHLGIDHARFRPMQAPAEIYARYGLRTDRRYLIYVGSEDPRKNLVTLLQALARVRTSHDDVELIKVGRAHFAAERRKLTVLAAQLGIGHAIHWLDDVSEEDLPLLYNLSDVCVMPSLYEGFGFPVLEAMACGTPVVAANAASLPEIAGDAALLFEPGPGAEQRLAANLLRLLDDQELRQDLQPRALVQAAEYTWERCVRQVIGAYYRERENADCLVRHRPSAGRGRKASSGRRA